MPFAILSIFVLVWGLPKVKLAMNKATTPAFSVILPDGKKRPGPPGWDVPYLHNAVTRAAPVVTKPTPDRKSTRLNSSHLGISYAVFCLKKKTQRRMGS